MARAQLRSNPRIHRFVRLIVEVNKVEQLNEASFGCFGHIDGGVELEGLWEEESFVSQIGERLQMLLVLLVHLAQVDLTHPSRLVNGDVLTQLLAEGVDRSVFVSLAKTNNNSSFTQSAATSRLHCKWWVLVELFLLNWHLPISYM